MFLKKFFGCFFVLFYFTSLVFGSSRSVVNFEDLFFNQNKIAVVQFSFDGVTTQHSGVGVVTQQTQQILTELNAQYQGRFKLYLVSADYTKSLPEYSAGTLDENRKICRESGGEVYLIPTSRPHELFGNPLQWEELCERGADICTSIINNNSHTIVLAHDTAYSQIPLKIYERLNQLKSSYEALWIPHATSWKYNGTTRDGKPNWPERHNWELKALKKAKACKYRVGYISPTIKKDLISKPFCADKSVLIPYKTGILLDKYLKPYSEEEIAKELIQRNIPIDKQLIFSIGRANPLKGLDITLEMYRHLKNRYPNIHLVMLAPRSDYMPGYLDILKERIKKEKLSVSLLDQFDSQLDAYIYQWPKTVLTALLSRIDTQPLTIMESRANSRNCILLTSDKDSSGNQVNHGQDGFTVSIKDLEQVIDSPLDTSLSMQRIVDAASHILDLPDEERQKIISRGKKLILDKYDIRKNTTENFINLIDSFKHSLIFEKINEGIVNPPFLVSTKHKQPLGILKIVQEEENCILRLKILSDIRAKYFPYLPKIFKSKEGAFLTQFQKNTCYFIDYIAPDKTPITTQEMLEITGKFHQATKNLTFISALKKSKREEFLERIDCFDDTWFKNYFPLIFSGANWEKVFRLSQYFISDHFRNVYEQAPKIFVHGDNNQSNAIKSKENIYLIDFDSFRYDIRLIDLASYFRYGGFEDYICLMKNNKLNRMINQFYGINAGFLTAFEESLLPSIVLFSHIEFISWLMKKLKQSVMDNNQYSSKEFLNLIKIYKSQILILDKAFRGCSQNISVNPFQYGKETNLRY